MKDLYKFMTMKHLIRQCHITEPKLHVMCIIGAKYPSTETKFQASGLPGVFDPNMAGKRMKLPRAETWETSVSLRGNQASTWQMLIDHQKLPFMAMLRNLRNIIRTGVDKKYHDWIISQLTNPQGRYSIINYSTILNFSL